MLAKKTCLLLPATTLAPDVVYDICRLQTADCKLKDTKNLPNKGDTIKNITSSESEKVAWEQG